MINKILLTYVTNPNDWKTTDFAYRFYHTKNRFESIFCKNIVNDYCHCFFCENVGEEGIEIICKK